MNRKIYNEYVTILERTCSGAWMHRTDRACLCCGKSKRSIRKDAGSYYDAVQR